MTDNGYGLWFLVVFNSLLFIVFAASFFHPQSKRDWRALGGFSAFVVALFTVLLYVYRRLAVREEREVAAEFGPVWARYAAETPRFLPRRGHDRRVAPPAAIPDGVPAPARTRRRGPS
jgi:protein-S-isoprenylcysteine O-methyltransferase Ste14